MKVEDIDELVKHLAETVGQQLNEEEDVEKIGLAIGKIFHMIKWELPKWLIESIDVHRLKQKLEREEDVKKIMVCLDRIGSDINHSLKDKLIREMDLGELKRKLEREEDISTVASFLTTIGFWPVLPEPEIAPIIDVFIQKLKVEKDYEKIFRDALPKSPIARIDRDAQKRSINVVVQKLKEEKDLEKIASCIDAFGFYHQYDMETFAEEVATWLVDPLVQKMRDEEDMVKIAHCLGSIRPYLRRDIETEMCKQMMETIIARLEGNLENIDCLSFLPSWCSEEILNRLEHRIMDRIKEYGDFMKTASFIGRVGSIDQYGIGADISKRMIQSIGLDELKRRLKETFEREMKAEEIKVGISDIAKADRSIAKNLRQHLRYLKRKYTTS